MSGGDHFLEGHELASDHVDFEAVRFTVVNW